MPRRPRPVASAHTEPLIRRIAVRRQRAGDPHLDECPDDPLGVLLYLRRHPASERVRWEEDVDALGLVEAARAQLEDLEESILASNLDPAPGTARRASSAERLGPPLGITTRQGVRDRLDRLRSRHSGRRDEKIARAARAGEREAPSREDREREWIAANADHLLSDRSDLVSHRALWESDPDAVTWLDEIESDHRRGVLSPTAVNAMWSTLIILRESRALDDVGESHPVRLLLAAMAELREHARRRLPPARAA